MRILSMLTLAALALAQTPVHSPRDITATAKVWQMLADYHAGETSFVNSLTPQQFQLRAQLAQMEQQIEAAKAKLCAPGEKLTDRLMCTRGGK